MFEARFQTFDDLQRARGSAGAHRCVARRAQAARARRLRRAARRPPAERIFAGKRGAVRLAHRLYRLGRRRDRAGRTRGAVRRRPLHRAGGGAGRCEAFRHRASGGRCRPSNGWNRISKAGPKLGYDPWLHTAESAEKLRKACATAGAELVAVDGNPIDALWSDRPAPPAGPVTLRDIKLAGEGAADKLKRIQIELKKLRADALVVSDPQNVAWAFNIRGSDVAHTPLALAFAVIPREGKPALYRGRGQARQQNASSAGGDRRGARARRARPRPRAIQGQDRAARPGERRRRAHAAGRRRAAASRCAGADPIALMKAVKNHAEIAGSPRRAPARRRGDGAVPRLARARGADRQHHRDRRGGGAGKLPPRYRPVEGHFVPDHRRLGAERGDRALPRHPRHQPHARS